MRYRDMTRIASALVLAVTLSAGCASVHRFRASEPGEQETVDRALRPLLLKLGYLGNPKPTCDVPTFVDDASTKFVMLVPGTPGSACRSLGLHVSAELLRSLSPRELTAVLAHELAHFHLGHATTLERRAKIDMRNGLVLVISRATFSLEQEAEADRFAGALLTGSDLSGEASCRGVPDLLDRVAQEPGGWSKWVDRHPLGNGRRERARELCGGRVR
jgi:hypothetical protein